MDPTFVLMALSEEDQWTLIWWRIWRSEPGRSLQWARSLKTCIDELLNGSSESAAAIFWIRLYGALHDFREEYRPTPTIEVTTEDLDPDDARVLAEEEYFAELAADVRVACTKLLDAFSDDERLTIQWKRDHEAHPFLTGYDLKEHNGALKHAGNHGLVGKVAHRNVHEAVSRVRAERDDLAVARDLAQRVAPHVDEVITALEQFPKIEPA